MVLPVIPHSLTKIHPTTRRVLIKLAVFFSAIGCFSDTLSVSTNNWLYTSEVLKYYVPSGFDAEEDDDNMRFFKNATLGPWLFCWLDPETEYHCARIPLILIDDPPSDLTGAVQQSVHRAIPFMILGFLGNLLAFFSILVVSMRHNPYHTLFVTTIMHITAGWLNFATIIVYMASLAKEVGNRMYKPRAELDGDALFHYSYGFSFILLKGSFFATQLAALLSVLVYMSKMDERTFNRYQLASILKPVRSATEMDLMMEANQLRHHHSRMAGRRNSFVTRIPRVRIVRTTEGGEEEGGGGEKKSSAAYSESAISVGYI